MLTADWKQEICLSEGVHESCVYQKVKNMRRPIGEEREYSLFYSIMLGK